MDVLLSIIGALCIGLSLGILGSGGAILTVPVLVYLLHHPEKQSIAESLAIVGCIALTGAAHKAYMGDVHWKSVWSFAPLSMVGAFAGAVLSHPVPGRILLGVLALSMLVAAWMMMRGPDVDHAPTHPPRALWRIALDGCVVGLLIGFVGVGGGFLIIPALVLLGGLPMRVAVGTTLCITALCSGVSFVKHLHDLPAAGYHVDWGTIALFTGVGILGRFVGTMIGDRFDQTRLIQGFGWFLNVMAIFILIKEFWPSR